MTAPWHTDPRAAAQLALCATRLPATHTASGLGLGGMEYDRRYSCSDPRVRALHLIRAKLVTTPEAHFSEPTVEQAIDAAAGAMSRTATVDGFAISEREAREHRRLAA